MSATPFTFIRRKIVLFFFFALLFTSFYNNLWNIAVEEEYDNFDTFSESLILGKLSRSEHNGIFFKSGFSGINFESSLFPDSIVEKCDTVDYARVTIINTVKDDQLNLYTMSSDLPDGYCAYLSQIGGAGYFYTVLSNVLPFENATKYSILKCINVLLIALCLTIFLAWVYRNFGFISSFVSFIFLFLSHWIVLYCGNGLWWSLWNFYIPFLTVLLLLEKRNINPEKISNKKIYIYLFLAVFAKCFFTGFEFITIPLLSIFCPVIYYYWLEKKKFSQFFIFSFKLSLVALVATLFYMGILVLQLADLFGSISSAVNYVLYSYSKRAVLDTHPFLDDSFNTVIFLIRYYYLKGNAFEWGFFPLNLKFSFMYLFAVILFFGVITYYLSKKSEESRKYTALLLATFASFFVSISWIVFFKDHALWHPHLDYIIWYMSFLLYGFAVIGTGVSLLTLRIRQKKTVNN